MNAQLMGSLKKIKSYNTAHECVDGNKYSVRNHTYTRMNIIVIINYFCIFFIKNIIVILNLRLLTIIAVCPSFLAWSKYVQTNTLNEYVKAECIEWTHARGDAMTVRWGCGGGSPILYRLDTQHKYHIMLTISRIHAAI